MASVETTIGGRKYLLSSDDDLDHLKSVADMVSKKIASLQKERGLSVQKAAIIASFDLASLLIKGKKRGMDYRAEILSKAHEILSRVHGELDTLSPN